MNQIFTIKSLSIVLILLISTLQFAQLGYKYNKALISNLLAFVSLKHLIGLSMGNLTEDVIVTDDLFRAPLFSYAVKFGLPKKFD